MTKTLIEIVEDISITLEKMNNPKTQNIERTIFLNKLESELQILREKYQQIRPHKSL